MKDGKMPTKTEIVKAYHKIALREHPDKVPDEKMKEAATEKMKKIIAAKDFLLEPLNLAYVPAPPPPPAGFPSGSTRRTPPAGTNTPPASSPPEAKSSSTKCSYDSCENTGIGWVKTSKWRFCCTNCYNLLEPINGTKREFIIEGQTDASVPPPPPTGSPTGSPTPEANSCYYYNRTNKFKGCEAKIVGEITIRGKYTSVCNSCYEYFANDGNPRQFQPVVDHSDENIPPPPPPPGSPPPTPSSPPPPPPPPPPPGSPPPTPSSPRRRRWCQGQ